MDYSGFLALTWIGLTWMAIRRFSVGKLEKKDLIWVIPTAISGTFVSLDYIARYWSKIAIPIPQTNSTSSGYVTVLIPRFSPPLPTPVLWVLAGVFFLGLTAEVARVIYDEIKSLRKAPKVEPQGVVVEPVVSPSVDAEKLRALSPIHMMIMAIQRVSPREASFGPAVGVGIGRLVRYDTPNLNLDKVRSVFSEYSHVLGDHHLEEWLKFNEQMQRHAHQNGFWVGKREWQWFDELEREYQDTATATRTKLEEETWEFDVKWYLPSTKQLPSVCTGKFEMKGSEKSSKLHFKRHGGNFELNGEMRELRPEVPYTVYIGKCIADRHLRLDSLTIIRTSVAGHGHWAQFTTKKDGSGSWTRKVNIDELAKKAHEQNIIKPDQQLDCIIVWVNDDSEGPGPNVLQSDFITIG